MSAMVVTVTPTVMDGTVVRWFESESAAEDVRPIASASRNGVRIHGYLNRVPAEVVARAEEVFAQLRDHGDADWIGALATHRSGLFGPLRPVEKGSA